MEKRMAKVVNIQDYREKKEQLEIDRKELLNLIKQLVTTK